MGELFGLPAHPLLIHAPLVLVPIVAVLAIVAAFRPGLAARFRWPMVALVAVCFVGLVSARQSGIALEEAFDGVVDVEDHSALGDVTTLLTLGWLIGAIAVAAVQTQQLRTPPHSAGAAVADGRTTTLERSLLAAVAVVAVLATIWLVRTGHSGAYSHWSPVSDQYFD